MSVTVATFAVTDIDTVDAVKVSAEKLSPAVLGLDGVKG